MEKENQQWFFFIKGAYIKIYSIKQEHINNCYKIDNKVMKKDDRPYVGIVLELKGYNYFAPLTSATESKTKLNNQTTLKLFDEDKSFLGAIRFNNMIPCKYDHVELLNFDELDIKYKKLVQKQYQLINYTYKDRIKSKAIKVYEKKINNPNDFVSSLCCDFTLLEKNIDKK